MKLLIVDACPLIREGLAAVLSNEPFIALNRTGSYFRGKLLISI